MGTKEEKTIINYDRAVSDRIMCQQAGSDQNRKAISLNDTGIEPRALCMAGKCSTVEFIQVWTYYYTYTRMHARTHVQTDIHTPCFEIILNL